MTHQNETVFIPACGSAGKHIGQTVPETFALTVRSSEIPTNKIFQIIRKSLSMLMFIAFGMVIKRE
jgi:hypothetical protein